MGKKRLAVICGGQSAEHEISLSSSKNVLAAIDRAKFDVLLVGIDRKGNWHELPSDALEQELSSELIENASLGKLAVVPGQSAFFSLERNTKLPEIDVVFPVLHGPFGEDGTVQGMLRLVGLPFVGPDVLASAACMDKQVTRSLLNEAGISGAKYVTIRKHELTNDSSAAIALQLGLPCFVKPANMGSSVGVSKAGSKQDLQQALVRAFNYDTKVIVESAVEGREIECAVLGNAQPRASLAGEIIPAESHGFYSYDSKYTDQAGAELLAPADLSADQQAMVQATALKAYQALNCEGMARVDVFLTSQDKVLVNEINTIPGFTNISMYPKLWGVSGVACPELIEQLIDLAIERHAERSALLLQRD